MRNLMLYLVFFCALCVSHSYGQSWQWMRNGQNGRSLGHCVTTDLNENIYVAGGFCFAGHFGPFAFSAVPGPNTLYLAKYDSAGTIQWLINAAASNGGPTGLTTDVFGNIYMIGCYDGSSFTFGGYTMTAPSSLSDSVGYFIAKVSSTGSVLWVKSLGNVRAYFTSAEGHQIASDKCGNIYVTVGFDNNPVIDGIPLTNTGLEADILVAKLDSSGYAVWARSFGGRKNECVTTIKVAPSGNIYVGGGFHSDSLQFGSTILIDTALYLITSSLYRDWSTFVVKLDNSGNPLWAKNNSGKPYGLTYDLAIDDMENVFICGALGMYSNPPAWIHFGAYSLFSDDADGFVVKYDCTGSEQWIKGVKKVHPYSAITDPCGNIWMFGSMNAYNGSFSTVDGHMIPAPYVNLSLTGSSNTRTILAGWTNAGTYISANALATGHGSIKGLASDRSGKLYITTAVALDTFILAGDSIYNTVSGGGLGGHPMNMMLAQYDPHIGCGYATVATCGTGIITSSDEDWRSICVGAFAHLSSTVTGGRWSSSNPAVAIVGSVNGVVTGIGAGAVTVTYTIAGSYATTTISVNPLPTVGAIVGMDSLCVGDSVNLTNITSGGSWYNSNTSVATVTSGGVVFGYAPGTDTIFYAVANSCGMAKAELVVNVRPCVEGINDINNDKNYSISIYPNPANEELHIEHTTPNTAYKLCNMVGAVMQQGILPHARNTIPLRSLPPGIYLLHLTDEHGRIQVKRVVKE